MICSTLPIIANTPLPVDKTIAQCGKWITLCGKGKHYVSYFLGTTQAPVSIWYQRETTDDELYVNQFDETIANAPAVNEGSFTFDYAPYSDKTGDDEIVLVFEGSKIGSRISIRLDCPEDQCLPEVATLPPQKETSIACGKYWHQAGYVKKNTINLGDKAGYVNVIWDVLGHGQVIIYQDKSVIKTFTSNRNDSFTFWYDPENGPVYAMTQGTASVDYIFSCPFVAEEVEVPVYEFTCGPDPYNFTAPLEPEVKFPVMIGVVDFKVTTVSTVSLIFKQNNVAFYVLSNHTGTVEFSYDYDPENGPVTIQAEGYGAVSVIAMCPVKEQDPTPVNITGECGTTVNTYAGYSNLLLDMNNISGTCIFDFVITDTPIKVINGANTLTVTTSGSYNFTYDRSADLIVQARGNDYQMRVSCPVRQPVTGTVNCGEIVNFDSYSNITVKYGTIAGNTTITTSQDASVYRDGVLVGVGRNVTFFYSGSNVVVVRCTVTDEYITINASCPKTQTMNCGPNYQTFNAGDIIDVAFKTPLIQGHVKFGVQISSTAAVTFRLGNTNIKTSNQTEEFEQIIRTAEGLRIVTTGSGQVKVKVECAVAIYEISTETKTEKVDCLPGQTAGGVVDGPTFVTATWTVTKWSDGTTTTSTKTFDGVCSAPAEVPIRPARWGVAMFANKNFTGGPIASEITDEEKAYGVTAETSPSGKQYPHWTGIQDFADKVMTHQFTPTSIDTSVQIETTINVDEFVYIMWDKRAASAVQIINMGNNFETTFDGVLWRNDLLGNYEGLPEYDESLPIYLTVQYDDGTGLRDWVIIRQEATTLPQYAPRTDKYAIKYKV